MARWPTIRSQAIDAGFGALAVFGVVEGLVFWPEKKTLFVLAALCALYLAGRRAVRR